MVLQEEEEIYTRQTHAIASDFYRQTAYRMIEGVLEKDSRESHFIQICDFISYFVHLYYLTQYKEKELPNRVANLINKNFVVRVMATLSANGILNEKASHEKYGLVIYPKE